MVGLALVYLAFFAVLMATGADRSADDDPAKLIADYDIGDVAIQLVVYGAVAAAAVLVFFGAPCAPCSSPALGSGPRMSRCSASW